MVPSPTSNDGGGDGTAAVAVVEGFTTTTTRNISKKEQGRVTNINFSKNNNEDHDDEDNQRQNQKTTKHHHHHPLSQIYLNLRKSACEITTKNEEESELSSSLSSWPDSTKFCSHLNFIDNQYVEPNFKNDGDGPIGVYAMLYENYNSLTILDKCRHAYNKFVIEFKEIILQQQQLINDNDEIEIIKEKEIDNLIMNIEQQTYHICISMFQEHPSLIQDVNELKNWKLIDYETRQKLILALSNHHTTTNIHEPPKLVLDSILFTKDGAMIAGFIDISTNQSFNMLRSSSTDIGRNVLDGKVTTRPKNLIHVTIGRILGIPQLLHKLSSSSDEQRRRQRQQQQQQSKMEAAVTDLMVQYNEKIFPNMVESMEKKEFILENVSLVRTNVWPNGELEEFQAWPSSSSSKSSSSSSSSKSYPIILK